MYNFYETIYKDYEDYLIAKSKYDPKVGKHNTYSPEKFPFVSFVLSDCTNSNNCSLDKREMYDNYYFSINIYTQDKVVGNKIVASQVISDELINLTIKFFDKLNMYRTSCRPTPNIDEKILRTTIQYQCGVGNMARLGIIRR